LLKSLPHLGPTGRARTFRAGGDFTNVVLLVLVRPQGKHAESRSLMNLAIGVERKGGVNGNWQS